MCLAKRRVLKSPRPDYLGTVFGFMSVIEFVEFDFSCKNEHILRWEHFNVLQWVFACFATVVGGCIPIVVVPRLGLEVRAVMSEFWKCMIRPSQARS